MNKTKKTAIIVAVVVALAVAIWSGVNALGGGQGKSAGVLNGSSPTAAGKPAADDTAAKDGQPIDSTTTAPGVSRGNGPVSPSGAPAGAGKGEP